MTKKPVVDIYKSGMDGKWVVHIDTCKSQDIPELRVYMNDDIENPLYGDALESAVNMIDSNT